MLCTKEPGCNRGGPTFPEDDPKHPNHDPAVTEAWLGNRRTVKTTKLAPPITRDTHLFGCPAIGARRVYWWCKDTGRWVKKGWLMPPLAGAA